MICPKCNTVNDEDEKFCKNCGFQLNTNRVCPNCNAVNKPNAKFCSKCGTTFSPVDTFKKDVIEDNAKGSFFSLYKVPIICALVIVLAIGAVAGVTMFSSGDNGGGINSIIPLANDTFDDSKLNDYDVNHDDANQSDNKTLNDTKKATMNKTDNKNTVNSTNKTKIYTEKTNSSDSNKKNTSTSNIKKNNTKKYQEKTNPDKNKINNNTKPTDNDKSNKAKEKNKSSDSKSNDNIVPVPAIDEDNDTDDINETDDINDIDDINETDIENDTEDLEDINDTDDGDDSISSDSIEMTDVPNLAQEVAARNYRFSSISYKGHEFTQSQCIDIFSEYIVNVNNGRSSSIDIDSVRSAPNPSGEDLSQSIDKSDYLSIASRVHSWIDGNDQVPNYVGVSSIGPADLSPEKMLELFSKVILSYSISEELPQSVDI